MTHFALIPLLAAETNMAQFLESMSGFLGGYYIILALMNAVMALYLWQKKDEPGKALVWVFIAAGFVILSPLAASGNPGMMPQLPQALRDTVNSLTSPTMYSVSTLSLLLVFFIFRRFFTQPLVAWTLLNVSLLVMGMAMADPNFAAIVTKPDNVPIVSMVFLLGYFTWLAGL